MIIYLVINQINNKQYVGQTIRTIMARWWQHCNNAKKGSNLLLHKAIRKYGSENFEIKEIGQAENSDCLDQLEIVAIKKLNTITPNGYNLSGGGKNSTTHFITKRKIKSRLKRKLHPNFGKKASVETREKQSKAHVGIRLSPKHKANISIALTGHAVTIATRQKLHDANKGHVPWNVGRKLPPLSPEHKRKLLDANLGKKQSKRTKLKRSKALKGKPWSQARQDAENKRKQNT